MKTGGEGFTPADRAFRDAGLFLLVWVGWLLVLMAGGTLLVGRGAGLTRKYLFSAGAELLLALPAVGYILVKRIRLSALFGGFRTDQAAASAVAGVLLVPLSLAVSAAWELFVMKTGGNILLGKTPAPATTGQCILFFVTLAVLAPLVEEPAMRGLALNGSAGALGRNRALALVSVVFAVSHGKYLGLPSILLGAVLLGGLAWRSGSLWPGVVAHASYNAAIGAIQVIAGRLSQAGAARAHAVPQALQLEASTVVFFIAAIPFAAMLAAVLWAFWQASPPARRTAPRSARLPLSALWPWLAAGLLLFCYLIFDVLRVYGIIRIS